MSVNIYLNKGGVSEYVSMRDLVESPLAEGAGGTNELSEMESDEHDVSVLRLCCNDHLLYLVDHHINKQLHTTSTHCSTNSTVLHRLYTNLYTPTTIYR